MITRAFSCMQAVLVLLLITIHTPAAAQTVRLSRQQMLSAAGISQSQNFTLRHEAGISFFGSMKSKDFKVGLMTSVEKIAAGSGVPERYFLSQNYPNPFNASTRLEIHLPVDGKLHLDLYSVLGQKVKTLYSGFQVAGRYRLHFEGTDESGLPLSSGLYFCRMQSGDWSDLIKMTIIR